MSGAVAFFISKRIHKSSHCEGSNLKERLLRSLHSLAMTLLVCLFFADCVYAQETTVRVLVIKDADEVYLGVNGKFTITDMGSGMVLKEANSLKTARVMVVKDVIKIGNEEYKSQKLAFTVLAKNRFIYINSRPLRGEVFIIAQPKNKFLLVNRINVEDYLYGVLYHEVNPAWHMEALKAQAVAARTFAIYKLDPAKDYDLTSDIYSQVYGGRISERGRSNKAVDLTKGMILTYESQLLPAYFHATCAGHTEDASSLWKINMEPLKGVTCNYCKDSPHFRWRKSLSKYDVQRKLFKAGYRVGIINSIEEESRDRSGRLTNLVIKGNFPDVIISAKDFRQVLHPNFIRSTNFMVDIEADMALFSGLGWGHGVGLCQWGAKKMSESGSDYKKILQYYYPGAEIASSLRSSQ